MPFLDDLRTSTYLAFLVPVTSLATYLPEKNKKQKQTKKDC
jgi:hypothetical protein